MKNIKYEITEIRTTPLVLEIPQMSDERWQELARKNAVRNYTRENGREPESVAQAVAWQRERVKMEEYPSGGCCANRGSGR